MLGSRIFLLDLYVSVATWQYNEKKQVNLISYDANITFNSSTEVPAEMQNTYHPVGGRFFLLGCTISL